MSENLPTQLFTRVQVIKQHQIEAYFFWYIIIIQRVQSSPLLSTGVAQARKKTCQMKEDILYLRWIKILALVGNLQLEILS